MAATSAAAAESGDDGDPERCTRGGPPGRGVDQVVPLLAVPEPAAAVASGRGDSAACQLERDVVGDADGPRAAADGEIAAGVDEAGADDGEELRDAVDGVALADSSEVEAAARLELDPPSRRCERRRRSGRAVRPGAAVASGATASNVRS